MRQVVRNLEIDVVWRNEPLARPALINDVGQLFRDVHAPPVGPAVLEPVDQLVARIVFQNIDVQFPLACQPGHCEVAAAQEAGDRVVGILPVQQIQLGVQGVPQVHLDHQLLGTDLGRQLTQRCFVLVGRKTVGQLQAELFGNAPLGADRRLVVDSLFFALLLLPQRLAQLIRRVDMHADQQAAAVAVTTRPAVNVFREVPPTTQVEIADAKVGAFGCLQRLLQCRQECLFYVVEDSWH